MRSKFYRINRFFSGRNLSIYILIACCNLLIVSCGGGGGGNKTSNNIPTNGGAGTDVTATGCANVVFIKNDAPAGGDGSQQRPFNTLEAFGYFTANVIYMMSGTGTTLNQDTGVVLYDGQKLLGDSISYSDDCNTINAVRNFSVTGPLPSITNTTGGAINLQGNNEVAGIRIDSPMIGVLLTSALSNSTTTTIHHNVLIDASISGVFISGDIEVSSNDISNGSINILDDETILDIIVMDNTLSGIDSGIRVATTMTGQGTTTISGNTIENSTSGAAIQIENRSGSHTVEDNTISDTKDYGVEFDNVSGIGVIRNNAITNTLSQSIFVETESNQNLELTIEQNVLNDNQPDIDHFASGINISMRDNSMITGTLSENTINDAGRHGFFISNLNNSLSELTINGNAIDDADSIGLFLDNQSDNSITTVVSNNTINRSGDDAIEVRINNDGNNNYSLTNNQITDAGSNGVAVNIQGDFMLENLVMNNNTINGSIDRGIDILHTSGPGNDPFITSSFVGNTLTANGEEGIRMFFGNNADAHSHVTDNSLINNGGDTGFYARATGTGINGALCIALTGNESDTDYELQVLTGGILGYEDSLSTNDGFFILDEFDGTLGAVPIDTCRDI